MYKLYIKDTNAWTAEGYSCMQWEKEKKVVGYFFGSYDTTFYTEPKDVTREECLKTVTQPCMCGNNRMSHDNGVYSFERTPNGDGRWMATEKYSVLNCVSMTMTMTKQCETCPIVSPFGTLTTDPTVNMAIHGHTTYIWNELKPSEKKRGPCGYVHAYSSTASLSFSKSMTNGKLRDDIRQLEYLIEKKEMNCSESWLNETYTVKGFPDAIITLKRERLSRTAREIQELQPSNICKGFLKFS